MATQWTIGAEGADPHGLASFWALALGYVAEPGYVVTDRASIIHADDYGPTLTW